MNRNARDNARYSSRLLVDGLVTPARADPVWLLATTLLMSAVSPAGAQQSARDALRNAQQLNWLVRVISPADTVAGTVFSIFRDSARIGERRVFIPGIERVERRIETRDSVEWRKLWPPDEPLQTDSTAAGKTPRGTVFVYAAALMLLAPEVIVALPPPIAGGLQFGARRATTETTLNLRMLVYPAPVAIFAVDLGQNFMTGARSYGGVAAGFVTSFEGGLLVFGAARVGGSSSASRYELRADAFVSGPAIVMSLAIGFGSRN